MEAPYPHRPVGDGRTESDATELEQAALWRNTSINIWVDQAFPPGGARAHLTEHRRH